MTGLQRILFSVHYATATAELSDPLYGFHRPRGDDSWSSIGDGPRPGCSPPVGDKWDRWDMAGSTYNYCYAGCHTDWMLNNSDKLNLSAYAGVVGVDHYWTGQGVPCGSDGLPHEFAMQDRLADKWKTSFPGMRVLSYRITSAVPYDAVIRKKMISDPDYFVRWEHAAGNSSEPGNGSICQNYLSPCFNDPRRINDPAHNCSFEIRAAAYNWNNPAVGDWYLRHLEADLKVAGITFVTGSAVNILTAETDKGVHRKKLNDLLPLLDKVGASENDLDKAVKSQVTKAREY